MIGFRRTSLIKLSLNVESGPPFDADSDDVEELPI